MADRLKDKVAVVTGAGSVGEGWGNGKATAVLFAREGAKVLCADINADAAQETAGIITGEDGVAEVFVVDVTDGRHARDVAESLRDAGLSADRGFDGRSMKAQMKGANRSGARAAVIIGGDEAAAGTVTVRDLRGDNDQQTISRDDLVPTLRTILETEPRS